MSLFWGKKNKKTRKRTRGENVTENGRTILGNRTYSGTIYCTYAHRGETFKKDP
jgi:hypothetical protein